MAHSIVKAEGSDPMRCLQSSKEEDQIEINKRNQFYWCEPIILVLMRLKQEPHKFKACLQKSKLKARLHNVMRHYSRI